jgi:tetratricopeptide (TPR) repeat protein
MKPNYFKLSGLLLFAAVLSVVSFNTSCKSKGASPENKIITNDPLSIPALFERKGELAKAAEWEKTKEKVAELNLKIVKNVNDIKARLQIAVIYISEVRTTGQQSYYYPAIHHILDGVLALDQKNFEAWVYKASVKMSQHQFAEAKAMAEKAMAIIPDNAYVYGVLVDANVELGKYQEAIAMSDKMQALKPSLESYSRASYLREIFGDYPGAIQAMQMAVAAGIPGSESCEWARVALGDLYLISGHLDDAENIYETSLQVRPAFPNAEIGLAKTEKARKNYTASITHTENAIRVLSESSYVSMLADLYFLKGDTDKAKEIYDEVLQLLEKGEKEQANVPADSKHNGNRELAMACLNTDQTDKALEYAQADLNIRPDNIDANELLARIAYIKGEYTLAKASADKMLLTNTMNPNYLYLAGLIYKKSGEGIKGQQLIAKAQAVNKYTDEKLLLAVK